MRTNKLLPRFDENTLETLDIRQMVGKYLVKDVLKKWTEDYRDSSTGDIVKIERCELLFKGRTLVTNELASKINFSIQAGEITEPIELTDTMRLSTGNAWNRYRPILVKVCTCLAKPSLMLWADSFEHAIEVATDYFEQNCSDDFYISEVKNLQAVLVDRNEFYEKQEEQADELSLELNTLRFYTIDVIWKESGTPYPFVNPSKTAKENLRYGTFICMAESLDEVKEIIGSEVSRIALENDNWKSIEIHYEKGKPLPPSIIVPKSFCDKYKEHYNK